METILTWLAVTVAGLIVSAHTTVQLPVLGPTPVLAVVVLTVTLTLAVAVLWLVRTIVRDGLRLRPGMAA